MIQMKITMKMRRSWWRWCDNEDDNNDEDECDDAAYDNDYKRTMIMKMTTAITTEKTHNLHLLCVIYQLRQILIVLENSRIFEYLSQCAWDLA